MNGVKSEPQKEQTPNKNLENRNTNGTGRTWDGSRQNKTVDHLLKLSHRGYGNNGKPHNKFVIYLILTILPKSYFMLMLYA